MSAYTFLFWSAALTVAVLTSLHFAPSELAVTTLEDGLGPEVVTSSI